VSNALSYLLKKSGAGVKMERNGIKNGQNC